MGVNSISRGRRFWPLAAALTLILAGCGGGGGGGGGGAAPAPAPPPRNVTVSGTITFDYVPSDIGGLDYDSTFERVVRYATVQFVRGTSTVLAATTTDQNGAYSLRVPENSTGFIRVRAEAIQTGARGWDFQVRDNTDGNSLYTLDGASSSTGTSNSVRDLHAESGWTGTEYGEPRAAAPFAILDTILFATEYVHFAEDIEMPELDIHWSELNIAETDASGETNPGTGQIGTSFYGVRPDSDPDLNIDGIYLLGAEDDDTEEYDRHVIVHEFGHYLERQLGRSDSIGGPHGFGDVLDIRVAFSEGWGTAFAALALADPAYIDTGLDQQSRVFTFNVEAPRPAPPFFEGPNTAPGWFSEESVWELIYDMVDTDDEAGTDNLALPFDNVWSVIRNEMVTTSAVTSVFPFLNGIKVGLDSGDVVLADELAANQSMGTITSDFGDGATNNTGSADVFPLYTELDIDGAAVNVCSTDEFSGSNTGGTTGSVNKLSSRRFVSFTSSLAGPVLVSVEATEIPADAYADPDFIIHRQGPLFISETQPTAACQDVATGSGDVEDCVEEAAANLETGLHILEVYEWTNTQDAELNPEFEPIGRTCFDVTVTRL